MGEGRRGRCANKPSSTIEEKKNNTINPISSAYVQYSSGGHFDTQSTTRTNIFSAMLPRRKERR